MLQQQSYETRCFDRLESGLIKIIYSSFRGKCGQRHHPVLQFLNVLYCVFRKDIIREIIGLCSLIDRAIGLCFSRIWIGASLWNTSTDSTMGWMIHIHINNYHWELSKKERLVTWIVKHQETGHGCAREEITMHAIVRWRKIQTRYENEPSELAWTDRPEARCTLLVQN